MTDMSSARKLLAIGTVLVLGWRMAKVVAMLAQVRVPSIPSMPHNDVVAKAIDLLIDESRTVAQTTIVLVGVLGAVWVAKADETHLRFKREFWPEIVMWFVGVLMLLTGLYCYHGYVGGVANALEAGGTTGATIPNVFLPSTTPFESNSCDCSCLDWAQAPWRCLVSIT